MNISSNFNKNDINILFIEKYIEYCPSHFNCDSNVSFKSAAFKTRQFDWYKRQRKREMNRDRSMKLRFFNIQLEII